MNEITPIERGSIYNDNNRAYDTRRDNDTVTTPKVTLYDIDYAVYHHLKNDNPLQINQNGNQINIPVIFANAEKWTQIQKYGILRDEQRKMLSPLIVIKRNDLMDDDRLNFVRTNIYQPTLRFFPYRQSNMTHDRTRGQVLSKDSYEFYTMAVPRYVRVTYDILIWTDLVEQMNDVVQTIYSTHNHLWGDYWKFRTTVTNVMNDNMNMIGEDRYIKTTMNLQVDGYLLPEQVYSKSTVQKQFSIKRVKFMQETEEEILYENENEINNILPKEIVEEPIETQNKNLHRNIRYNGIL